MSDSIPPHLSPRPQSSPPRDPAWGGTRSFDALASLQTVGALLVGILLFAVPLYLWRRPRSSPPPATADAAAPDGPRGALSVSGIAPDAAAPSPVKLTEARVLECHDKGSRRTAPEQCDHIPAFEKAFGEAIEANHLCVPPDAGAGSIEYVADLSFARRRSPVMVVLPRDGRSFQSFKIARDCAAGVRARLSSFPITTLTHAHARYKISLVASYAPASPR